MIVASFVADILSAIFYGLKIFAIGCLLIFLMSFIDDMQKSRPYRKITMNILTVLLFFGWLALVEGNFPLPEAASAIAKAASVVSLVLAGWGILLVFMASHKNE